MSNYNQINFDYEQSRASSSFIEEIELCHLDGLKEFLESRCRYTEEFSLETEISPHSRIHTNEERPLVIASSEQATFLSILPKSVSLPFLCSLCHKRFTSKRTLDKHFQAHVKCAQFKCPFKGCEKEYRSKENMNLHYKNIHLNDKPYKCKYCSSLFSHRNGKRLFLNLFLGKTYHERKFHTHVMPYVCDLKRKSNSLTVLECGQTFASKSSLTYHKTNQHDENVNLKMLRKKTKKDSEPFMYSSFNEMITMGNNNNRAALL